MHFHRTSFNVLSVIDLSVHRESASFSSATTDQHFGHSLVLLDDSRKSRKVLRMGMTRNSTGFFRIPVHGKFNLIGSIDKHVVHVQCDRLKGPVVVVLVVVSKVYYSR